MSEKELDEILNEIKGRSSESEAAPAANEASQETPQQVAPEVEEAVETAMAEDNLSISEEPAALSAEAPEPEMKKEGAIDILSVADVPSDDEPVAQNTPAQKPKKKNPAKAIIIALIVIIIAALGVLAYLYFNGFFGSKDEPKQTETTTQAVEFDANTANPLTGEMGFNKNALDKRPVAVVVENEYSTEAVRPQWGIADADIVMEGESEFSTRLLFFWADMNMVPDQVGPARSARPPFIRFSQMWDSVFIHAGLSRSKDDYEGADTVFENEKIDHINLLSQTEDGTYFGRDNTRQTAVEHTGYLNGKNTVQLIANNKIDTELNEGKFTRFEFNEKAEELGEDSGVKATFKWSDKCPKEGVFTYDEDKHKYVTEDFDSKYGKSNVEFETLIYLLDETEYIVKENYKHSGQSETYCNYALAGGEGKMFSEGTSIDIKWEKEDGKLVIKTADGEDVKLNRGKIYIGYGSSNHGGSIVAE